MAFFTDTISINTIVGEGSALNSSVKINGNLRVEGDINGDVVATGSIFIGERARIHGNIVAISAEIYGIVEGNVDSPEFIKMHSSAAVVGDVFSKRVQIDEKAIFHGHCISIKDLERFEQAKREQLTKRAVLENRLRTEN